MPKKYCCCLNYYHQKLRLHFNVGSLCICGYRLMDSNFCESIHSAGKNIHYKYMQVLNETLEIKTNAYPIAVFSKASDKMQNSLFCLFLIFLLLLNIGNMLCYFYYIQLSWSIKSPSMPQPCLLTRKASHRKHTAAKSGKTQMRGVQNSSVEIPAFSHSRSVQRNGRAEPHF